MHPYELILFDWDGCLADTLSVWLAGYRSVFDSFGLQPTDESITGEVFGDWNGSAKLGIKDIDSFNSALITYVNSHMPDVKANPGALELVRLLSETGMKVGVLTSSGRSTVAPHLDRLGFGAYVDLFLGKEDVKNPKPDPEIIEKARSRFGIEKNRAVMIGDSDKDVLAGKSAGIGTILYYPVGNRLYYRESDQLALGADYLVHAFSEIGKILCG